MFAEGFGFDGGTVVEGTVGVPAIFNGCTAALAGGTGVAGDAGAQSPVVAARMQMNKKM